MKFLYLLFQKLLGYHETRSLDQQLEVLVSTIILCLDKIAPIINITPRPEKSWNTSAIKKASKKRDKLNKKLIREPSETNRNNFIQARRIVSGILMEETENLVNTDKLFVLFLDIRSLRCNINELRCFIEGIQNKPFAISLCETWLTDNDDMLFIPSTATVR